MPFTYHAPRALLLAVVLGLSGAAHATTKAQPVSKTAASKAPAAKPQGNKSKVAKGAAVAGGAAAAAVAVASSPSSSIELVQPFDGDKAEALRNLVAQFNRANPEVPIELVSRDWRAGSLPHLMILDAPDAEHFLSGPVRYKPLHALMKEAGQPLQTLRPPASMARTTLDAKSQLVALPVGLSTPVMYYNRQALRKAGVARDGLPPTWFELQQTLGQLADAGNACPYTVSQPGRVMVENLSAWHNQPISVKQEKGKEALAFNGLLQVKHVAMMASWHRARYLRTFSRDGEAEQRFASGECAVIAAPSSSWPSFRKQGLDVGVAALPFHDDVDGAPQNTLADGPALWVAAGKNAADYKVVARFVRFWLEPQNQVAWERATGYLPLNHAGVYAMQSETLGPDLENIRVAIQQLVGRPATPTSEASPLFAQSRVRRIMDEELEQVWADTSPAKLALDNAVSRSVSPR